jgi:hypothetical protein
LKVAVYDAAGDYFVQVQIGDKIDGQAVRLTR